jgi:hypothetical protein
MTIPLTPVTSSQIESIGFDEPSQTLAICFKSKTGGPGSVYHYAGMTRENYIAFASAESIGSHFYKHIKSNPLKYPYTRQ